VAIKAQVWTTGWFKAEGIKFSDNSKEPKATAKSLLGASIKGLCVEKMLVEKKLDVEKNSIALASSIVHLRSRLRFWSSALRKV